jgi:hypothetical protein
VPAATVVALVVVVLAVGRGLWAGQQARGL